jgi:hypothetical protein
MAAWSGLLFAPAGRPSGPYGAARAERRSSMRAHRGTTPEAMTAAERREGDDRRLRSHLRSDWTFAYRGRRRASRRTSEESTFVDLYDPMLLVLAVSILLLSVLDAAFTLMLLEAGVIEEANPLMRWLIEHDTQVFINLKIVITATAVVFLVLCSNAVVAGRLRGRRIMHGVVAVYVLVIIYELLIFRISGLA